MFYNGSNALKLPNFCKNFNFDLWPLILKPLVEKYFINTFANLNKNKSWLWQTM